MKIKTNELYVSAHLNLLTYEAQMAAAAAAAPPQISDTYQALMKTANNEHGKHYAAYKESADRIGAKIAEWTKRLTELSTGQVEFNKQNLKQEVIGKVKEYKQLREMRDNIPKIVEIYKDVIYKCYPPYLNPQTMKILEKLGLDTASMMATYNLVFTSELAALKTQQAEFEALYASIRETTALPALRTKLQEILVFTKEYNGFPEPTEGEKLFSYYTPHVTAAIKSLDEKPVS